MAPGKKIYFLSDFHLGAPDADASLLREKRIVRFLTGIAEDAAEIFIVGDVFDFWYEYRNVVPKGYVRLLGTLAQLHDRGIILHFFAGNHDMWLRDYFQKELGMKVYMEPAAFNFNGKSFYVGHGDGLGPGDHRYKAMKKLFRNPVSKWLFGALPPYIGMGTADFFSRKSRKATGTNDEYFLGEEKEWLVIYAKEILQKKHFDFFVFAHRHLPLDIALQNNSRYLNLGDWIKYFSYAEFDGAAMELKYFKD